MKKKVLRQTTDTKISYIKPEYSKIHFTVILIEPEGSINVGFICRSMKNFGFSNLIVFNPKCQFDSDMRKYSMHARKDVLEKAEFIHLNETISKRDYFKELKSLFNRFNYVIGTSSKPGMFRNIKRINFFVDELDFTSILNDNNTSPVEIAIVFGRESQGLHNEELNLCDFTIKIPTSDEYPSMNLSHAVSIVLFTIYKKIREIRKGTIIPSTREQKDILYRNIASVLEMLEFPNDVRDRINRTFINILGRSFSSMKEVNLILTLFKRIQNIDKLKNNKKEERMD